MPTHRGRSTGLHGLVDPQGPGVRRRLHKPFSATRGHAASALIALAVVALLPAAAHAWQINELQYQYGELDIIDPLGGGTQGTHILTTQHASGWTYGDNFFFADFSHARDTGEDVYLEAYAALRASKLTGRDFSFGPIADLGPVMGINYGKVPKVRKFLPGLRLNWAMPGFTFLNTDLTAYIDDSAGVAKGGAPKETNSFMVDVSWALPLVFGRHRFSIEGHIEYIDGRYNEFGERVSGHVLGQPQFRYDLGNTLADTPNKVFVGMEYQFWINKLGDAGTDEHAPQLLLVWRL